MRAIQLVSTERGRDPRDYALVPFGGAGPLHAARIAEELGISTIVVPPNAGVISAYGLVASDYTKFDAVTRKMKLDEAAAKQAGKTFAEMRRRLAAQFADMKLPGELVYTHTLDMQFVGQAFEVGVEIPADKLASLDAKYIAELFADAHHRTFMHGATLDRPVEIVTLRVGATLPIGAAPEARPRNGGAWCCREHAHLPRRGLGRVRSPRRRSARPGPDDRRPGRDRGPYRDKLGAARLEGDARQLGQPHPGSPGMSRHRRARHMAGLVAVVVSLAVAAPAFAQKPSAADIDEMLPAPPDSHAFPSYKWASDAPIKPLIVTGGQEGRLRRRRVFEAASADRHDSRVRARVAQHGEFRADRLAVAGNG